MITKDIIKSEIDKVNENRLEEVYYYLKMVQSSGKEKKNDLFSNLRNIEIRGPRDFSSNFDSYLNGEKVIE